MFPATAGAAAQRPATANSAHTVFVIPWTLRDGRRRPPTFARLQAVGLRADHPAHTARWTGVDLWRVRAGVGLRSRRGIRARVDLRTPVRASRRAPEIAGPLSRPADRAPHRGRCNFPDAVRSSDPSRNRYSHSAIRARTLRAAVERFRAREEPPAAPRHKAKTPPPHAELVRHYTGESRLGPPERRALGEAQRRVAEPRHTGAVRPVKEDRKGRRLRHQRIRLWQLQWRRRARL